VQAAQLLAVRGFHGTPSAVFRDQSWLPRLQPRGTLCARPSVRVSKVFVLRSYFNFQSHSSWKQFPRLPRPSNRISYLVMLSWSGPVADALNQDVQALKEWLRKAWLYLADPASTATERRELRNYMKEADCALRAGLQKLATIEPPRNVRENAYSAAQTPQFRIFKASIDADLRT
jgi:hypothetical protein